MIAAGVALLRAASAALADSVSGLRCGAGDKRRHAARGVQRCSKSLPNARCQVARTAASGAGSTVPEQHVGDLMHAARRIERRDHRLDDDCAAVDRARIAPAFQRMRQRQVPLAKLRGFVGMQARMDAVRHMRATASAKFERARAMA